MLGKSSRCQHSPIACHQTQCWMCWLQVVDFGEMGPVRCSQPVCRAYINPFFKFFDAGRRFYCNMCGAETNTPAEYVDVAVNRRMEGSQRPELSCGTVEFCADLPQFQVETCLDDCAGSLVCLAAWHEVSKSTSLTHSACRSLI